MVFRLQSQTVFCTYSQANALTAQQLFEFYTAKGVEVLRVGTENHQDGGLHYHVYARFITKLNSRDPRYLDVEGVHPNIVSNIRNHADTYKYCGKDNVTLDFGPAPEVATTKRKRLDGIFECATKQEFLDNFKLDHPRDYIVMHDSVIAFANKLFKPEVPSFSTPDHYTWNVPQILIDWAAQRHIPDRPKSLILHGPSRTGKTQWARSIGPHLYFNGYFNMDQLTTNAEYAIFDDFEDWSTFKQYKQWLGAQQQFVVTDKYKKKLDFIC